MPLDEENNEIGEELNIDETETNLVNNVIPKPKSWGESSRRSMQFVRPKYVPVIQRTNFFFGFIPRKTTFYEEITLPQLVK